MNTISTMLANGRRIRELEQELATLSATGPRRRKLGAEHARLMRRQQDEIVAAHQAGVGWDTITCALALHGQGADREPGSTEPTPAEQLGALLQAHGAERVMTGLDALRAAHGGSAAGPAAPAGQG